MELLVQPRYRHRPKRPDLAAINRKRSADFRVARSGATGKKCNRCGEVKLLSQFGKQSKTFDGVQTWCRPCAREHNRAYAMEKRASGRGRVLEKFGNCCGRCGFSDIRALQIDHVNGGGMAESRIWRGNYRWYQKVLADTSGAYQLLCANCNWIKRHERGEKPMPRRAI